MTQPQSHAHPQPPQQSGPTPSQTPSQPEVAGSHPAHPLRSSRRFGPTALAVAALVGLVLGTGGGLLAGGGASGSAASAAVPAGAPTISSPGDAGRAGSATPASRKGAPAKKKAFRPQEKDFSVSVKIREKQCFGSLGCNVTFEVDPDYEGDQALPESGEVEVTYEVRGSADGPIVDHVTLDGGGGVEADEEYTSIKSPSARLKAKVTEVSYEK